MPLNLDVKELIQLISEALEISSDQVNIETVNTDIEEWDSLGQIAILARLDEKFADVTEKVPDLASATSVRELHRLLTEKS